MCLKTNPIISFIQCNIIIMIQSYVLKLINIHPNGLKQCIRLITKSATLSGFLLKKVVVHQNGQGLKFNKYKAERIKINVSDSSLCGFY